MSASMRAGSISAATSNTAPFATAAFASRAILAACVPIAIVFATPNAALYARTLAYGSRIFSGRGVGVDLGREVFGGAGNAAGAFGWLNAVLLALGHAVLGDLGVFLLTVLFAGGAIACVAAMARARANVVIASCVAALALFASLGALRIGVATSAWCAGAAFLFCALRARDSADESHARRWIVAAIVSAVVWCNCSAYGIAAPLIAAAYAIGVTLSSSATAPIAKRAWLITFGAALATLATPAFITYPGLSFGMLAFDRDAIAPLAVHPIEIDAFGYRNGFVAFALLLAALGIPRARRGIDAWAVVAAFVLALENGALLALLAFVAAPSLAEAFGELVSDARGLAASEGAHREQSTATSSTLGMMSNSRAQIFAWGTGAAVTALVLVIAHDRALPARMAFVQSSVLYAQTLQHDALLHRIACERIERCADIVAIGDPNLRVLMDDRVTAYPANVRKLQTDFAGLKGAWLDPLVTGRTDALVVENGAHIDVVLNLGKTWHRLGSDEHVAVYARNEHAKPITSNAEAAQ